MATECFSHGCTNDATRVLQVSWDEELDKPPEERQVCVECLDFALARRIAGAAFVFTELDATGIKF